VLVSRLLAYLLWIPALFAVSAVLLMQAGRPPG
jgi:hypothetical protein